MRKGKKANHYGFVLADKVYEGRLDAPNQTECYCLSAQQALKLAANLKALVDAGETDVRITHFKKRHEGADGRARRLLAWAPVR